MPRMHIDPTLPSDHDVLLAQRAACALEAHRARGTGLCVQVAGAGAAVETLELPAPAARLLMEILKELGAGNAVTVAPIEAEITTQQVADLLNVSRPYVVGLIEKGTLPARMVGNQRRLPLRDVLAYRTETKVRAHEALLEMAAIDQELGLR